MSAVLLRPLPFAEPDKVVVLWEDVTALNGPPRAEVAPADYAAWRERARSFEGMAIGLRMALGAERGSVVAAIVRNALVMVFVRAAIGLAGALGATRVLRGFLFEVSHADPATFAVVPVLLLVVAVLASLVPARRAARVDPAVSLRAE